VKGDRKPHSDNERILRLGQVDYRIRGSYLVAVLDIEWVVSEILATHFFPSIRDTRRVDLIQLILRNPGFTLHPKVSALGYLLKRRYKGLWTRYSQTIKKLDDVVIKHRNLLAHAGSAMNDRLLSNPDLDRILLVAFRKGSAQPITISAKQHDIDLKKAEEVRDSLMNLWKDLLKRTSSQD